MQEKATEYQVKMPKHAERGFLLFLVANGHKILSTNEKWQKAVIRVGKEKIPLCYDARGNLNSWGALKEIMLNYMKSKKIAPVIVEKKPVSPYWQQVNQAKKENARKEDLKSRSVSAGPSASQMTMRENAKKRKDLIQKAHENYDFEDRPEGCPF